MSEAIRPYALSVTLPAQQGYAAAEALGFDEMTEALSVSIFDDGPDHVSVQALYETQGLAEAARKQHLADTDASVAQMPDEDWVGLSQSGLAPIRAGRFVVHGSHDTPPADAPFPILVEAGQAFGTGHHGTTQGCLEMMDRLELDGRSPATILDLGTGAGILAIAAAKLFPEADILATDIDPVAVDVAKENAQGNGVEFDTVVADGFGHESLDGQSFDLVIANILAGPLRGMAPDIAAAVKPGGTAILSGILDEQAEWVAGAFRDAGLTVEPQASLDGWTSLLAHK